MPVGVHIILLFNGVFTLTVTDTETEADKMDRTQWEFVFEYVSVQCELFHTILHKPLFIGMCICLGFWPCKLTITRRHEKPKDIFDIIVWGIASDSRQ